jgi:hypothetical protein
MIGINIDKNKVKKYAMVALAYLLLSVAMFYPMILNMASTVPGSGGDVFQSMWDLWWVPYSMFELHTSPYFTNYLFYPVGANLATQTFSPIAGLVSVLFQPAGLAFAYNMIFLIGFVLSGFFAYLLAHHITKHDAASFIAGFIYAFSPMHVIQSFGHLQFINIEFIPLFLLFFLKMIEERKTEYAVYSAISFVLLTFMGDIEQGLMTVLLAFFVLAYMAADKAHRNKILDRRFAVQLAVMLVSILVIGSPFFAGVIGGITSATLSEVNSQANAAYNALYSPDLFSFMIPSHFNGLLAPISNAFSSINSPAASERTTYAGLTVLALALMALAYDYKDRFKHTGLFIVPLAIFALLSLGPYLQVAGNVTGIPGIYQIYHAIPFFNVLREPGRFDLIIELMLGILAAIGIVHVESKYMNSANAKKYLPLVLMLFLVIEYNSWPTSQAMATSMYANATIPKAYYEIGSLPGNFTVLALPALPNPLSKTPALYPGMALYYQTAFKKPLIGGYTTRVNSSQTLSLVNVPLIASTYYLQAGEGLVYGSPLVENFTHQTEFLFGAYNIGFVSVMGKAFNATEYLSITSYLTSVFGSPVYNNVTERTIVFSTTKIVGDAGSRVVSYTPVLFNSPYSVWQPGWVVCANNPYCSETFQNLWFGANPVFINIYAPNYTRINVSMRALSPTGPQREYVYVNNQQVRIINMTSSLSNYTMRFVLNPGVSQLVFYTPDENVTGYSNIAVENITITR